MAYAAYNKNLNERLLSSSGGIFSLLAREILAQGGVVFGATMDETQHLRHICISNVEELEKLRGSKYLQSEIGNTYVQVKKFLLGGGLVLFTGTPCQIEGLLSYLGKSYENLYTQDLICHGVPSPMVWEKYLKFRGKIAHASVRRTYFRHKKYGWNMYALSLVFSNDKAYIQTISDDLYMQSFLQDFSLRPSCYNCQFKKLHRKSDITLADFWGIQDIAPEMDDDKGTSLVIIHSEKGKKLWETIQAKAISKVVPLERALLRNPSMTTSVSIPKNRDKFMEEIQHKRFDKCVKKYIEQKTKFDLRHMPQRLLRCLLGDGFVEKIKGILRG